MKLDDVKKLHQKKYRTQFGCYLVEGEHLVIELEKAAKQQVSLKDTQLYVTEKYQDWAGPFYKTVVSDKQMAQLSDTKTPQGILARVPLPKPSIFSESIDGPSTDGASHLAQDERRCGTVYLPSRSTRPRQPWHHFKNSSVVR